MFAFIFPPVILPINPVGSLPSALFTPFAFMRRCNRSELRRIQWSKYQGGGFNGLETVGSTNYLERIVKQCELILAVLYFFETSILPDFDTYLMFEWKLSQRQVVILTLQVSEHWISSNFMTNPRVPYERKFLKLQNVFERSTRASYSILSFQLLKNPQKLHKKHQKKNRLNPCFPLPLWPSRTPFAQRWRKHSFQLVKPLRSDVTFEQTLKLLAMQRHGSVPKKKEGFPGKSDLCVFCSSCSTMFVKKRCRIGCIKKVQWILRSCRAEIHL